MKKIIFLIFCLLFTSKAFSAEVVGSIGKTVDGWSGAVPVYMSLTDISSESYPYARVLVNPVVGDDYYVSMSWDAGDSRYEGTIYVGSNLCNGCADPNVGTFSTTVQLDNNADFSSIDYSDASGSFDTFITRRWPNANSLSDYTDWIAIYDTNHWNYTINDFAIASNSSQSNVAVAIPFHPITSSISNISVTFNGTPVSEGAAASTVNAWWWDSSNHVLYIQFQSLSTSYVLVDITFDSDTDLFATRIDRYYTSNFGERLFYNGLVLSNSNISTSILGGGHEGAGEQVDVHGKDSVDVQIDCMERTAIYVDDTLNPDSSGYYIYNIKWKQNQWADYIVSENNNNFVLVNNHDDTSTTGWKTNLDDNVNIERTLTFYADKNYIKNDYEITNADSVGKKYSFVWGREPWLTGGNQGLNDRGRVYGDISDRNIDDFEPLNSLDKAWIMTYDDVSFNAQGFIFKNHNRPDYGYFVKIAPITTSTAEWPVNINDESTQQSESFFFSKTWDIVNASESLNFTFWQWGSSNLDSVDSIINDLNYNYDFVNFRKTLVMSSVTINNARFY